METKTKDYSKVVVTLLSAGINPKYKAFAYLVHLLTEVKQEELLLMSNKEMIDMIRERFNSDSDRIVANFKCMMDAGRNYRGERGLLFRLIPRLEKGETPSVAEFTIAASCYISLSEEAVLRNIEKCNLSYPAE